MSHLLLDEYPASSTIYAYFPTYSAAGASITMTNFAVGDILIYKNGSTTQRSSTAGFTLLDTDGVDFDSVTGAQGFSVDLSDNTDASFYTTGAQFGVFVSTVTVDSQTITVYMGSFRIVAAEGIAGTPKADVSAFGGSAGTFASGRPEVNTTHIAGSAVSTSTAQLGVNVVNWKATAVATPAVAGVPSVDSIAVSGTTPSTAANLAAAVRDVSNASPAGSSLGEAINNISTSAEDATAIQAGFDNNQAAYANAIWLYVINGSHTALGVMRGMRSWLFGGKANSASLTPVFKDPESGVAVITGVNVSVTGDRDASTLNLS